MKKIRSGKCTGSTGTAWAYTRLGKIVDKTPEEMEELLGNGDVTITLSKR